MVMEELWKRVDPHGVRTDLDKIHEFIEGLRPEFVVPVQSAMPETPEEAIEKARALETAFSMGMDLSAHSMLPGYLQNMNGGMVPAKTNVAMYQPAYIAKQEESIEQLIERKIKEGMAAALGQFQTNNQSTSNIGVRNNNGTCYNCGRAGHIARNCRQRNQQNEAQINNNAQGNNNNSNNRLANVQCYNCGRNGHISRNCRTPPTQQQNRQNFNGNNNNSSNSSNSQNRSTNGFRPNNQQSLN